MRSSAHAATIEQELGDRAHRTAPPAPASGEEQELVEQFARAFVADDIDRMVALVTQNAWFRMPPARQEYHGPELIGAFLAAVSEGHSGQSSRLIATRANGEPAFATYYIDPLSGLAQQSGLLVLAVGRADL